VGEEDVNSYKDIEVQPFLDFRVIEEVMVLIVPEGPNTVGIPGTTGTTGSTSTTSPTGTTGATSTTETTGVTSTTGTTG